MNLNDDVVDRCLRLGPLHQLHPGRSRRQVRYHNCKRRRVMLTLLEIALDVDMSGDAAR
jgi:hypothetical protein